MLGVLGVLSVHTGCAGYTGCTGCAGCAGHIWCTGHAGCTGHTGCTGCAECAGYPGCTGHTGSTGCTGHTGESRVSEPPGEGGGELLLHRGRGGEAHRAWSRDTAFPLLLDGKVTQGWIVSRQFHKPLFPEEPLPLSVGSALPEPSETSCQHSLSPFFGLAQQKVVGAHGMVHKGFPGCTW